MGPGTKAQALRTFKNELAYENDELLGTDPQPEASEEQVHGYSDSGGVHINSGIPNHAFFLVAIELGGRAWERAGLIWLQERCWRLNKTSSFKENGRDEHPVRGRAVAGTSKEAKAVTKAWKAVGF
jgi:Zn-dependent metalloprotease